MAIPTIISSEYVTVGNNATIPSGCTMVVSLDAGSTPSIAGVAMSNITTKIYKTTNPPSGTKAITGASARFVYLSNCGESDGNAGGYNSNGLETVNVPSSTNSIIFGWVEGSVGTTGLDGFTLLDSGTMKTGYKTGTGNPTSCTGRDNGGGANCTAYFASFPYSTSNILSPMWFM
jgi:hypothetical protein